MSGDPVTTLADRITRDQRCRARDATGLPDPPNGLRLPDDVAQFYRQCGGADLFESATYGSRVVSPPELARANLTMLGTDHPEDRSHWWFVIVTDPAGSPVTVMDLHPDRLGRCYDAFHETYGLVGDMAIVAPDFTSLLAHLLESEGARWYWLSNDWIALGDAYD